MIKKILGWGIVLGAFLTVMTSDAGMPEKTAISSINPVLRFVIMTLVSVVIMAVFFYYHTNAKGGRDAWNKKRKRLGFFGLMTDIFAMGVFVFLWVYIIVSILGVLNFVTQQNFWLAFAVLYAVFASIFGISYVRRGKNNY